MLTTDMGWKGGFKLLSKYSIYTAVQNVIFFLFFIFYMMHIFGAILLLLYFFFFT